MSTTNLDIWRPGVVAYDAGLGWQQARAAALHAGAASEALALLEHTPVYTFGMRARREHVLVPIEVLAARGAEVVETDRGGDVTFHGPGQLVAYPILDLRTRGLGPASYVRMLEACLITTLARFDVRAERVAGRPGVWVNADGALAKIAAVGVRVREGVSTHGVALNVSTDLEWFEAIVPCGIADAGVTSMQRVLGVAPSMEIVMDEFAHVFVSVFDVRCVEAGALLAALPTGGH
jgi:lipoyl(octanoyl) transferase